MAELIAARPRSLLPAPLSVLAALAVLVPAPAWSQHIMGPRSAGMGETHRGIGTGNDAIHLNPAAMSLFPRYVVESFWRRHAGRNETLFSLSVLDSATGPVAAGLAYTYDYAGSGGSVRSGSRMDVSTSYALAGWLLTGSTVRYIHYRTEDGSVGRLTSDVGFLFRLGEALSVGIVGHNVFNPTDRGDVAPRSYGVGAGAVPLRNFVVGFDYRIDPEAEDRPASYSLGAEYFFLGHFALRGGWVLDERLDDRRLSVGGSYVEEVYGLDVSYGRSLSGGPGYEIAVGLRLFIN